MDNIELLTFRIDSLSPDTIPMARLAEYLKELSALYGSEDHVHFAGLSRGSVKLAAQLDEPVIEQVRARLTLVKYGAPPPDALRAYTALGKLLKRDNAAATIYAQQGENILVFPGRDTTPEETITISQPTTIDGVVIKIGGRDDTIPVHVQDHDGTIIRCVVKGYTEAKRLAQHYLDKPIRIHGNGKWIRGPAGWRIESLAIQTWEPVEDFIAEDILARFHRIDNNAWLDHADPVEEWRRVRGLD